MTNDQRVQISAVANKDKFCAPDTFSTGLLISFSPAKTSPHFKVGAQKCTVLGPVSLFQNLLKAKLKADADIKNIGLCFYVS